MLSSSICSMHSCTLLTILIIIVASAGQNFDNQVVRIFNYEMTNFNWTGALILHFL